jgi:hypothetical protein
MTRDEYDALQWGMWPCKHAHPNCSYMLNGACSDETASAIEEREARLQPAADRLVLGAAMRVINITKEAGMTDETKPTTKAKKARPPSRGQRWMNAAAAAVAALSELQSVQQEYQDWLDNLPENLKSSALGEKLETVCEIDIESAMSAAEEAEAAELPQGFGRD